MITTRLLQRRAVLAALTLLLLRLRRAEGQTEEELRRPYSFGFTIENMQHRQEEKNELGVIMGEFGFITADGFYHTTVYATDEQGNFRIVDSRRDFVGFPPDPINPIRPGLLQQNPIPTPPSSSFFQSSLFSSTQAGGGGVTPASVTIPRPLSIQSLLNSMSSSSQSTLSQQRPIVVSSPRPFQSTSFFSSTSSSSSSSTARPAVTPTTYRPSSPPPLLATTARPLTTASIFQSVPGCATCGSPPTTPYSSTAGFTPTTNFGSSSGYNNRVTSTESTLFGPEAPTAGGYSPMDQATRPPRPRPFSPYSSTESYQYPPPNPTPYPARSRPGYSGIGRSDTVEDPADPKDSKDHKDHKDPKEQRDQQRDSQDKDKAQERQDKPQEKQNSTQQAQPRSEERPQNRQFDLRDNALGGSGLNYRFNYTARHHGHQETGYSDGSKTGDYYVNTEDGVGHRVSYEANEFGYQPLVSQVRLSPEETPQPGDKDDLSYQGIDFVWFTKKRR